VTIIDWIKGVSHHIWQVSQIIEEKQSKAKSEIIFLLILSTTVEAAMVETTKKFV
jgi:hypothetical protein